MERAADLRHHLDVAAIDPQPPSLADLAAAQARLAGSIARTPMWRLDTPAVRARVDVGELHLKLELLQVTGSFKARAALLAAAELAPEARARGLVAVSAGNHALAVAHAAARVGTTATLVMPRTADPSRIRRCRELGGAVVLVDDVHVAFAEVERIVAAEGRAFLHPFEGETVARGTGTIGLELLDDVPDLDAVIVPIGGGGLCAGIAAAVKQRRPQIRVFGVEPEGADSMHRSFAAGRPMGIEAVRTIADSLGAPHAAPYSFALCRRFVDELVRVDDDGLRDAMALLFEDAKLVAEPAGAAATAALLGPLRRRLAGARVAAIVCGGNVDVGVFTRSIMAARPTDTTA